MLQATTVTTRAFRNVQYYRLQQQQLEPFELSLTEAIDTWFVAISMLGKVGERMQVFALGQKDSSIIFHGRWYL